MKVYALFFIMTALFLPAFSESIFTDIKGSIVKSIIKKLDIKHFVLIKGSSFRIRSNAGLLTYVKDLHRKNIFTRFLDVREMNNFLKENYYIPTEMENVKRVQKTLQPLRSLVLLEDDDKLHDIFKVNNEI